MPRLLRRSPISHLIAVLLLLSSALLVLGPANAGERSSRAVTGAKLTVPTSAVLTLSGRGFGHGRGLSQYGAEGAARQGLTAAQILAFYYPGTTLGHQGGTISVLIGADTTPDTRVVMRSGLIVRSSNGKASWNLAALRPTATQWRLNPRSATKTAIAWRAKTGGWKRLTTSTSVLEFWAGGAPIALVKPSGTSRYRGALRNAPYSGRDHDTVNVVGLEDYLKGVVPSEMPASWSPAAVQAQAVAARTYAAYSRAHASKRKQYQICDSTSCQVYKGVAGEASAANAAIKATQGLTLMYGGKPAFTQFSSSSGGWTVAGTVAYQKAKADPYDNWSGNRQRSWTVTVSPAAVARAWPAIGKLTALQVLSRDGNGDWGGRVLRLRLIGTAGSTTVDGTAFRSVLGLKSTYFDVGVSAAPTRKK